MSGDNRIIIDGSFLRISDEINNHNFLLSFSPSAWNISPLSPLIHRRSQYLQWVSNETMGHPKRAFWATPMTDPTMGPHSADWCCCSAKCARCRNRSDIYDKTWQNCHRLSEYESWVTKPWPWPLLEKKVGSLHIWHLVCRTFCSSSTLKSEFFVFPLHLHMHMIIWAYFSAHFCASTQDKSVKTLVIDFEVWTCPHFHRRRSLTGRSTLLSVPQVSKPLVSVFIIGLSYGSRNVLSYPTLDVWGINS